MIRQIKKLNEATNYMFQFIDQLNDVNTSIKRDNDSNDMDLSYLENSAALCNQIIENISNQIEVIRKSEDYLKEHDENYGIEKKKEKTKRRN